MKIQFKQITMQNFKGVRNRTITFSPEVTLIQGRNKVGKTTVADACWWVLFGKDSKGNTSFGIKTQGEDLKPIPRLDHIVTLDIEVDGDPVTLQRQYKEDWTSRRGEEATLTGHHMVSSINGVVVKETEYKAFISNLCDEKLFMVLSKSEVFFSLTPEQQRALLVKMVGEKSLAEFAEENQEFKELIAKMGILDMQTYMNGISYSIKKIDDEVQDKESRIQENESEKSAIMEKVNFDELKEENRKLDEEINSLQEDLSKPTEQMKAQAEKMAEINSQIAQIKSNISTLKAKYASEIDAEMMANIKKGRVIREEIAETKSMVDAERREARADVDAKIADIVKSTQEAIAKIEHETEEEFQRMCKVRNSKIDATVSMENANEMGKKIIENYNRTLKMLDERVEMLRKKWDDNEQARTIQTICPTCHQPLPEADVENLKAEAQIKCDAVKNEILKELEDIKTKKAGCKDGIEKAEEEIKAKEEAIVTNKKNIGEIENEIGAFMDKAGKEKENLNSECELKKKELESGEVEDTEHIKALLAKLDALTKDAQLLDTASVKSLEERLRESEEYANMNVEISLLEKSRDELTTGEDMTETIAKIKFMIQEKKNKQMGVINALAYENIIADKNKRIKELEAEIQVLNVRKAELEADKMLAKEFHMASMNDLESRVNALFEGISFKMFEEKLNGNTAPCCKCYIGVTEYKDGSHAERINAGLQMIDTMAKYNDKFVPCFVDDAEGINTVFKTTAQQIRMIVTMEDEMKVIHM